VIIARNCLASSAGGAAIASTNCVSVRVSKKRGNHTSIIRELLGVIALRLENQRPPAAGVPITPLLDLLRAHVRSVAFRLRATGTTVRAAASAGLPQGVGQYPVGQRGARLSERQPAGRSLGTRIHTRSRLPTRALCTWALLVLRRAEAIGGRLFLTHVGTVLGGAVILVTCEVIDFRLEVHPHDDVGRAA